MKKFKVKINIGETKHCYLAVNSHNNKDTVICNSNKMILDELL